MKCIFKDMLIKLVKYLREPDLPSTEENFVTEKVYNTFLCLARLAKLYEL